MKRVKAEECRESWFSKSRDPGKGFGSPPTPGAIPLIRHTQAKPSRIIHPPPLPQCLLFPIRIHHPLFCPLCKAPPSPGIQCPALVLQPPQPDWKPLQGRDGWRVCISIYARVPIQEPGAQGPGKPPQLPTSDDPTLLPTWTPPGLEGALTLRRPVLGMLAPRLP